MNCSCCLHAGEGRHKIQSLRLGSEKGRQAQSFGEEKGERGTMMEGDDSDLCGLKGPQVVMSIS